MNEYDKLYKEIRELKRVRDRADDEYAAKLREQAVSITRRFLRVGWSETAAWWGYVCVRDPGGMAYQWSLCELSGLDDCLKALEAAEKAAQEVK